MKIVKLSHTKANRVEFEYNLLKIQIICATLIYYTNSIKYIFFSIFYSFNELM